MAFYAHEEPALDCDEGFNIFPENDHAAVDDVAFAAQFAQLDLKTGQRAFDSESLAQALLLEDEKTCSLNNTKPAARTKQNDSRHPGYAAVRGSEARCFDLPKGYDDDEEDEDTYNAYIEKTLKATGLDLVPASDDEFLDDDQEQDEDVAHRTNNPFRTTAFDHQIKAGVKQAAEIDEEAGQLLLSAKSKAAASETSEKGNTTGKTSHNDSDPATGTAAAGAQHQVVEAGREKLHDQVLRFADPKTYSIVRNAGKVISKVDNLFVVRAGMEQRALDLKSLLCLPDGQVVGMVMDVFGNIHQPHYLVFPTNSELDGKIALNTELCFVGSESGFAMDFAPNEYELARMKTPTILEEENVEGGEVVGEEGAGESEDEF
eukprot:g954.t1